MFIRTIEERSRHPFRSILICLNLLILRLIPLVIFCYSKIHSQNYSIKDVTNIEKDTIYSTEDISLISGLVLDHFENGMIKIYGEYKNGIKDGEYKKWHINGQLIFKGNFIFSSQIIFCNIF